MRLEVVTPEGEVLRTGMGAMTDNPAWHLYKRSFGPSSTQLFMQSNFGIVTKMGFWLLPAPETYMRCGRGCGRRMTSRRWSI